MTMQYFEREHTIIAIVFIIMFFAAIGYGLYVMYGLWSGEKQRTPDEVSNDAFLYAVKIISAVVVFCIFLLYAQATDIYDNMDRSKIALVESIKKEEIREQINDAVGVDRVVASFESDERWEDYKTVSVGLQASDQNSDLYVWKFNGGYEASFLVNKNGYIYGAAFQLPEGKYIENKDKLLLFVNKVVYVDVSPDVLNEAVDEVVAGKTTAFYSNNAKRDYLMYFDGKKFIIEAYVPRK